MKQKLFILLSVLLLTLTAAAQNNVIYYKSSDGVKTNVAENLFECNVVSHTYENGLGKIVLENDLTLLGRPFKDTNLSSILLPKTLSTIGLQAFSGCANLTEIICLNPTPAYTYYNTFAYVPSSCTVKVLGSSVEAYSGWGGFSNIVSVDNQIIYYTSTDGNVVTPNANNFGGANILSNTYADGQGMIVFDRAVTEIGDRAFWCCNKLATFVCPNTVTSFASQAFQSCSGLTHLTIGESVRDIGSSGLAWCDNLQEIISLNPTPPSLYNSSYTLKNVPTNTCLLKVPAGSVELYRNATLWSNFTNIIGLDQTFTITDGEDYVRSAQINGVGITYSRTFKNDAWQPLYIPFSMDYDEWSAVADVAKISGVHEYDDGTTLIEFRTITSGAINANTPYIIRAKQASDDPVVLNLENKTLSAAPAQNGTVWCASTERRYTLTGIYEAQDNLTGALVMSAGNFYAISSPATSLKAQRFYLTVTDEDHGYGTGSAQAPRHVGVMVDGEVDDELTAILTPALSLKGEGDGVAYDLFGRKVGPDYKGIVIINGKKVLKK